MEPMRHLPTLPSLLVSPGKPFIQRDISWLQFNERVLDEARESSGNPLLERLKFLAITASNLDEFFMIRVASLNRKLRTTQRGNKDDAEVARLDKLRCQILESVAKFGAKQLEVFDLLQEELGRVGIHIVRRCLEQPQTQEIGRKVFESSVLPLLSSAETFEVATMASLQNLKLAVIFPGELCFRVSRKVANMFSIVEAGETYFFFLDDLLESFVGPSFGLKSRGTVIRITRDGDITVDLEEEDSESVPDIVLSQLGTRELGNPVRLQYRGRASDELLAGLSAVLKLTPEQVMPAPLSLFPQALWTVVRESPAEMRGVLLTHRPLPTVLPPSFGQGREIFEKLKSRDYFLHHPYDSFDAYVEWVKTAAEDPGVVQIEQTIYRMDKLSPILDALKKAAQTKRVRVIVELRARFDEIHNLTLADDLRRAGVEVAYGFGKLKLHAKVTLVTRQEEGGVQRLYTHLSTGNYNATTARTYTDVAVLTSNPEVGKDARIFFDAAFDGKIPTGFTHLLSAPTRMHRKLLSLIEGETQAAIAGQKARIVAKVNALVDEAVIEALYRASQAGVEVKLIVRGACSLIPGVTGLSENIQVISVVDRFLEHSRIYFFESARVMYLSSADWMPRNFFSRLELAFPVLDKRLYAYVSEVLLPTYLQDSAKARELTPQGTWKRRARGKVADKSRSQFVFVKLAERGYRDTPLERAPEITPKIIEAETNTASFPVSANNSTVTNPASTLVARPTPNRVAASEGTVQV